jgi:hypothetical protein
MAGMIRTTASCVIEITLANNIKAYVDQRYALSLARRRRCPDHAGEDRLVVEGTRSTGSAAALVDATLRTRM